jgi:hypothetical protein
MGAGKTEKSCRVPFTAEHFKLYDKVADDRLYRSEISDEQLDCLVEHLIHTKDNSLRTEFRSLLQNDLWEAIKKRLKARRRNNELPEEIKNRIDNLLENEYSDDELIYTPSVKYSYEVLKISNRADGYSDRNTIEYHLLSASGVMDGNLNYGAWKLEPTVGLNVDYFNSQSSFTSSAENDARTLSSNNWGLGSKLGGSLLRRDEKFKLNLSSGYKYFHEPLPEQKEFEANAGGELILHDIGDIPLSLEASVDWKYKDIVPNRDDWFDPSNQDLSVYGEAAYMMEKAGLLLTYEYVDSDNITAMIDEKSRLHSGSFLTHIVMPKGFIRLGAGGGAWNDYGKMIEGEVSESSGAEIHAKAIGNWSPIPFFQLFCELKGTANHSDGTFIGWYPSGNASVGANVLLGDVQMMVSGDVDAHYRDLNETQTRIDYGVNASLGYAPTDYFNATVMGAYMATNQTDYDAYEMNQWQGAAMINFRAVKDLDLWFNTMGGIFGTTYNIDDTFISEMQSYSIMEQVTLKF